MNNRCDILIVSTNFIFNNKQLHVHICSLKQVHFINFKYFNFLFKKYRILGYLNILLLFVQVDVIYSVLHMKFAL